MGSLTTTGGLASLCAAVAATKSIRGRSGPGPRMVACDSRGDTCVVLGRMLADPAPAGTPPRSSSASGLSSPRRGPPPLPCCPQRVAPKSAAMRRSLRGPGARARGTCLPPAGRGQCARTFKFGGGHVKKARSACAQPTRSPRVVPRRPPSNRMISRTGARPPPKLSDHCVSVPGLASRSFARCQLGGLERSTQHPDILARHFVSTPRQYCRPIVPPAGRPAARSFVCR